MKHRDLGPAADGDRYCKGPPAANACAASYRHLYHPAAQSVHQPGRYFQALLTLTCCMYLMSALGTGYLYDSSLRNRSCILGPVRCASPPNPGHPPAQKQSQQRRLQHHHPQKQPQQHHQQRPPTRPSALPSFPQRRTTNSLRPGQQQPDRVGSASFHWAASTHIASQKKLGTP